MTSETEAIKTNEFLRRRKLRLQQVREQSKDIAKKIRQRAKVEKLRQVVDLDATKQKEYFECQDKLIKHLEVLYARGVNNVGAGHQSASELTQKGEDANNKSDLSKLRGKEAAAALRKQKQDKLDERKKVLDRKLQARETANEISRDKSTAVAQKLLSKSTNTNKVSDDAPTVASSTELVNTKEPSKDAEKLNTEAESVKTSDMATQWDQEAIPPEWEPAVPALSLPTDKDSSPREEENATSKTDKKRLDLFALSKEMPSSLRGKHTHEARPRETNRPSLTLVSEYLQSRKLRLRENDTVITNKKPVDDIQSLKQTILHTRSTKAEGSNFNVCHVLDEQVIPVPSWRAEVACEFCSHSVNYHATPIHSRQIQNVTNSQINQIFSSIRPVSRQPPLLPSPVLRGTSPFRRSKVSQKSIPGKATSSSEKPKTSQDTVLNRKNSVMMYNHSTRDTRDLPCGDNKLVVRDKQSEEDAYSQAMKEVSAVHNKDKDHQKKVQDMRNKVAVTKQNVEKEYKDTMNFLSSLPKEKNSKVIKTAYMDDRRQQMQQENRQQKMQQEYKKIEKECKKHQCMNKSRSKSKSPARQYREDNFDTRDFQYSWMPVPESDSNLAIHAIPNTVKQGRSGNSVKFSAVDSYHEYRSRHKHTPPTKDTQDKQSKKVVETVIIDKDASESSDSSSMSTLDTSSVQNLILDEELKNKNVKEINNSLSDAERIIIYKVLDSRTDKKSKRQTKLLNEIAKSLSCIEQGQKSASEHNSDLSKQHHSRTTKSSSKSADNGISFEQLNEGVYKMVEEQGDNVTSMYFSEHEKPTDGQSSIDKPQSCDCQLNRGSQSDKNTLLHWESGDCVQPPRTFEVCQCGSADKDKTKKSPPKHTSPVASTSSFITASNAKGSSTEQGGYIKLLDETGKEAGKFFIGAAGFLKNNAYEVVIQLRKKDGVKEDKPGNEKDEMVQNNLSEEVMSGKNGGKGPHKTSETDTTYTNNMQPPPEELREVLEFRSVEDKDSKMIVPEEIQHNPGKSIVSEQVMTDKINHSKPNTESSEEICLIQSTTETKHKRDQNVHTGYNHGSKPNTPPRPATTTYTQTTLSSPAHRPVFFHMSSSTSTAYMSPPEMILPKYFKRKFGIPEDELYDILYDPVETIEMTEKEYSEEYTGCTCTKCLHARKVTLKQNAQARFRKNRADYKKMRTPPNTARTPPSDIHHDIQELFPKKVSTPCKNARSPDKAKCKYSNGNGEPLRKPCRRNKKPSVENIPTSRNINNVHVGLNLKPKNKVKTSSSSHDKLSKSKLNPIIKDYINKLLALNKQGLKAVEVADQECSSVCTPGSSIINVPNNVDEKKSLANTISLEQIKNVLKQQIIEKHIANMSPKKNQVINKSSSKNLKNSSLRLSRKKPIHKVKSLNISKHLLKKNLLGDVTSTHPVSPSSTDDNYKPIDRPNLKLRSARSKSSPTPRQAYTPDPFPKFMNTESTTKNSTISQKTEEYVNLKNNRSVMTEKGITPLETNESKPKCAGSSKANIRVSSPSPDTETTEDFHSYKRSSEIPVSMSTQTNQNTDSDTKFIKLAEDKLHNMEKIADLTEKCTKRLSNLARVLEEVRKNKSLAYSQLSSADSTDTQSEHKSDRVTFDLNNVPQRLEIKTPEPISDTYQSNPKEKMQSQFMSIPTDIPKPLFKVPMDQEPRLTSDEKLDLPLQLNVDTAELTIKTRPKPPTALSRISLKHGQEYIVPHELSTVIEVDSPMSMKHKNQTSANAKDVTNHSNKSSPVDKLSTNDRNSDNVKEPGINPDILESNTNFSAKFKFSSTESSDDSKFQMIDLKQFNEIMLEPFISIQEYAKQYNMEPPDEGSNLEQREDVINDDMSSLHSDGSLPDVIAELLKRNIITEPFKFDTASNINSTTISSESTLSMLALSKARKDRKRSSIIYQNKESIAETSDTLSISSNPDLENAFKKLGMGWASSTLKKTKERLALSSSSNTSSSSIPHFKMKSFNQDIPALVTDSVSSALNSSKKVQQSQIDTPKNAEQQTSLSNSMTVKEFLRNELSKKITFNNKTTRNDTEEEFVSLFETRMPEDLKNSQMNRDDRSVDSAPSGTNRARTSTPVQIFKSMTYHSSSSSNVSNCLFSNADDLSSVKMTSNSIRNHSTSDKDDLTIPNFSLKLKKTSDCSKSD
ncbi:uncharacterized protein LOC113492863 isoform X3 [Trichoplusia ni]|uniref:Uncharacterized protein LOC113492863 isoform X3 n=1 Tax=Trichoplusia ni TaxID=7111 RepID=A0A7E5VDI3_TRINI|nr:uncharacterized protein LOC113492863 isoform X3 [Trichoplusia ni]